MAADPETLKVLAEALDDEYRARATYRKVIEVFGPIRPFVNIVESEERHIGALKDHYARLGVVPPVDTWAGKIGAPASVAEACRQGVEAEIENGAMYDRLIATVRDPAVRRTMQRLREASQQRHLPAFRRCAGRHGEGERL